MVVPAITSQPGDRPENVEELGDPKKLQAGACPARYRTTALWTACISAIAAMLVVCVVKGVVSRRAMHADTTSVGAAVLGGDPR